MRAPIQSPMAFQALRWFGIQRGPEDAISTLEKTVQPFFNMASVQRFESVQTSIASIAPGAAGSTLIWQNTSDDVHLVFGAHYGSAAALGAGITINGFLCHTPNLPTTGGALAFMQLSTPLSFTVGQSPLWSFWKGYDDPIVLLPGDFLSFWSVLTAGVMPALNVIPYFRVLPT